MRNLDLAMDRRDTPQKSTFVNKRYFIVSASIAFIILCLIGLSFYLLLKSEKAIRKSLNSMDSRLLKIEDRINRIESADNSRSVVDEQRTRLEISLMERMDSLETLIDMKTGKKAEDTLHSEAIPEPVEKKRGY